MCATTRQLMSGLGFLVSAQSAGLLPPTTTSSSACYNTTCRDDLEDGRASRLAAMISVMYWLVVGKTNWGWRRGEVLGGLDLLLSATMTSWDSDFT